MDTRDSHRVYGCADGGLVRAVHHAEFAVPTCPDLTGSTPEPVQEWCGWLRDVWAVEAVAEAIEHASPAFARQMEAVCAGHRPGARQMRRMVLAVLKYLLRMTGRATPFGLLAGVAPVSFGPDVRVRWGGDHCAVVRADASWLAEVLARLESCPRLRERLLLVTNNLCFVRGARLVVPCQPPHSSRYTAAVELSIRHTPAVRLAVETARSPIHGDELAAKLAAEFPAAPRSAIGGLLADLVERHVLVSSLHAPSTVTDAFGHLMSQLQEAGARDIPQVADLIRRLLEISSRLACHNRAGTAKAGRGARTALAGQMTALGTAARQPLAVDLRLDCALVLPFEVRREAEAAASALARLTKYPFGSPAWQSYHTRFFERYGIGALVPVQEVTDPDAGLGLPAGYLGSAAPEPPASFSARDERLLALAQSAALDGHDEILVDDGLITELAAGDLARARVPPHLELCFQVHAASQAAFGRGEFGLTIVSVSRAAGTMTGRFAELLTPSDQQRTADTFADLAASEPSALPVQLSFPPLDPGDAHVTRAPKLLPAVISLAEHRVPGSTVIPLEDLTVGCDSQRLYLASLAMQRRVEPVMLHALDVRAHTPPLARFLAEVARSQAAAVTEFDWGAASRLPFLPRLRYRRTVLSPARWRLDRAELPARDAPWPVWDQAMAAWQDRRHLPAAVYIAEGDRRLPLNLDQAAHRALLRTHLNVTGHTTLTEAPSPRAQGWLDGRAHEIVVPLVAAQPAQWPTAPQVTADKLIGRDHGHLPGSSPWLYVKLYGDVERQAEILAEHLPRLLACWDEPPQWWFIRYRDPGWHMRLRIALSGPQQFGVAAHRVSTWAVRLRRVGLLRDMQFAVYYPETGRWGRGAAMAAAEDVFSADSRALSTQFAQPSRPHPQALAAAHFVAIAAGFTGCAEAGMHWLIDHAKTSAPRAPARHILSEAVRLANPCDDWAALRAAPGGTAITARFGPRHEALARYRNLLTAAGGIDPDMVLDSLLHAHHIRAVGIDRDDERTCLRLARAAALASISRSARSAT